MEIYNVVFKKKLGNELKKLPKQVISKLVAWIDAVKHDGLSQVRKISGYHDEPLKGSRKGQRTKINSSFKIL